MISDYELEARLLYSLVVAGKSAKFAEKVLVIIMSFASQNESPFDLLKYYSDTDKLEELLIKCKTGNYRKLTRAIPAVMGLDLRECTVEDLEAVPGIGPKTARFFLLCTRPGVEYAALDTHILKWLRSIGVDAPKSTPPAGKKYQELERIFIREAKARGMSARELDWQIWESYAGGQMAFAQE